MQRELPTIDFTSQAEVRTNAEHRRAEELAALLRLVLARWSAMFQRRNATIFGTVQYVHVPANRKAATGQR